MKRSESWLINLEPTIGAEIRKKRPAIIVNNDDLGILPLKVIVPITDWRDRFELAEWMIKKIGFVDEIIMHKISIALSKVLKI